MTRPAAGDLGPADALARGDRIAERIATARGEVTRARRVDPLALILLGPADDAYRRRLAAERMRDLCDAAAGLQGDRPEKVDGSRNPVALFAVERNLDARAACARAWRAIGPIYSGAVQWIVIGWQPLSGYARHKRMRCETARAWLREGLDRVP